MRYTSRVLLLTFSAMLLVTSLSGSCISVNHNLRYHSALERTSPPIDAFVLVDIEQSVTPVKCHTKDKDVDCKKLMRELPDLEMRGSGSGLLVMSDSGPAVLTAAHVCARDTPDTFKHGDVEISLLTMVKIKVRSPLKGTYGATIIRMDEEKDLCLLKPEKVFTYPVQLAEREPELGDKVITIAAPFGISGRNLALIFNGYFSGTRGSTRFYTVPTRPGSSGAAVLNTKFEVVGVLHTAFRDLENVGMGTGLEDVRTFLFSPIEVIVESPFDP